MVSEIKKVENEIIREEKKVVSLFKKNYWAVATVVLAALLITILLVNSFSGISKSEAGQKVLDFAESRGVNATLVSVTAQGSLYEVVVTVQGQEMPIYVTKDGKNLVANVIPLEETETPTTDNSDTQTPTEVPKTDKPVADFYVFSYCPYGTQMEKALVPAYNLLKNKADINIVFIGAMHGEYEKTESLRQLCIQKNYGKDKLFAYLDKFLVNPAVGNCQGTDTCVNPLIETIYTQIGIDKAKISTCMTNDAPALYAANQQKAQSLGIGSSPTVTINGVESQVGRSPALVQQAICSGFTTTPAECNQTLSTASASAGFGSTASSGSAASCG